MTTEKKLLQTSINILPLHFFRSISHLRLKFDVLHWLTSFWVCCVKTFAPQKVESYSDIQSSIFLVQHQCSTSLGHVVRITPKRDRDATIPGKRDYPPRFSPWHPSALGLSHDPKITEHKKLCLLWVSIIVNVCRKSENCSKIS